MKPGSGSWQDRVRGVRGSPPHAMREYEHTPLGQFLARKPDPIILVDGVTDPRWPGRAHADRAKRRRRRDPASSRKIKTAAIRAQRSKSSDQRVDTSEYRSMRQRRAHYRAAQSRHELPGPQRSHPAVRRRSARSRCINGSDIADHRGIGGPRRRCHSVRKSVDFVVDIHRARQSRRDSAFPLPPPSPLFEIARARAGEETVSLATTDRRALCDFFFDVLCLRPASPCVGLHQIDTGILPRQRLLDQYSIQLDSHWLAIFLIEPTC